MEKIIKLPDYQDTAEILELGEELNPVELFINEQEPLSNKRAEHFRNTLLSLITYVQSK